MERKEYDKAFADFNAVSRIDPQNVNAYLGRGSVYKDRSEYDQAIAEITNAISIDPKSAPALCDRGIALSHKREFGKAITDCDNAIRLCAEDLRRVSVPRHGLDGEAGVRQGDRRLQRGDPHRSQTRICLLESRTRVVWEKRVRKGDRGL